MKACVLKGINQLEVEERPMPEVLEGWALVEVKAAGICGSDIPRIYKTGAHRHPLVPGHEFSGRVVRSGTRVGIFPLIPCGKCACCRQHRYEMCSSYNYLGSRCDGGFAQYVAVPEWNLLPLPDSVSYETAAMLEPMAVAVHAMRAVYPERRKGYRDTVAVCGLGTIGLFLVMFLKQLGVKHILAIGNKDFQKECIRRIAEAGAVMNSEVIGMQAPKEWKVQEGKENDIAQKEVNECSRTNLESAESSGLGCRIEFADQRTTDIPAWIQAATDGQGADVFFECVGKNETVLQAIESVKPGGRIELVGNPASDMLLDRDIYWKILRRQLTLCGTWNSSYMGEETDDWHYVLNALPSISPELLITHRFPLEEIEKGLHIMRDKTEDFVKIMILPK